MSNPTTYSDEYYKELWSKSGKNLNYAERFRIELIMDHIKKFTLASGLQILDYGCGRGWMTPFLSQFGNITGIDFGKSGVQMAQETYGKTADFIWIDPADANAQLSQLVEKFDLIVCSEVLEHITEQEPFLRQLSELLKPGGYCIFTTPNGLFWPQYQSRELFLRKILRIAPYLQPVENWIKPDDFKILAQKTRLKVIDHSGFIFHVIGFPPFGGLIKWEWHLNNLLKRKKSDPNRLDSSLYQCMVCQKT